MSGSYRECRDCGKRALSIATRCPGCGRELEPAPVPEAGPALELGRRVPKGVVAAFALAAVVVAVELGGDSRSGDTPGLPGSAGSEMTDSALAGAEVAYALGATARLDTASVEATPDVSGRLLLAKTWTNVRKSRSTRAGLEAVLTPGDTVLADSLHRDWYRVTFEGEVMGYAHRSTLAAP